MLKQLFLNWEKSVSRLQLRGITNEQLSVLKNKWERKNQLTQTINQLRKERNQLSKKGEAVAQSVINLKKELNIQEQELTNIEQELQELTEKIPNLPAENIPLKENKFIDEAKYKQEIKHNLTYEKIARQLEIIDEKASIKLSGSRFAVYQGLGAQLVHALINLMLSEQKKKGYQIFTVPYLVQSQNLYHTGQLPKLKEDMFKVENSDFYLIPTAEVPLVNLYRNEILSEKDLPLKLCAYSPCFRAEAGAAGQENKGLIRLHQFHKVELVRITQPENSYQQLKEIVEDARNILHLLKIPHRVIELCVAELGFSAAKTYDLEVWLPVSKRWLEISSCSNCESFQTERAKIRVKKENGQKYYPHSLNGSGLAIDRLIVVLLEYYYNQGENLLEVPSELKRHFFN
ncbi:MAG: seryl-tRNA synthetase [Mycoplasmataceae bacterium CE_OT135]|nr:MAG: seryl-tRNA synthetase [Mycoplasmataceae bacterium CE_OT135]